VTNRGEEALDPDFASERSERPQEKVYESGTDPAESKIKALSETGVPVGDTPEEVADNVKELIT